MDSTLEVFGSESSFSETCACNRTFTHLGAYKRHQNTCAVNNGRLSFALAKARMARKRKELEQVSARSLASGTTYMPAEIVDPSTTDPPSSQAEVG